MAENLDLNALERSNLGKAVRPEDWIAVLAYARRLERASQPGADALAAAMHDAAIRYANGHTVDFQHEAREVLLSADIGKAISEDAARWRTFERALRTGHLRGAAYGRRFKIIETCPMSGDEKEFNAFVEAIDATRAALTGGKEG